MNLRVPPLKARWLAEEGAVAVVAGLTLTILVLMAAFVIDLGFMRADRVDSKAVADMAAAAAVTGYNPETEGSAEVACEDAIAFATANLASGSATPDPSQSCSDIYDSYVCVDDVEVDPPASYVIDEYRIEVFIPVPTGDGLMEGFIHDASHDGKGCERVGVRVQRDRSFVLAGVAGFADGATTQSSVGRSHNVGTISEYASLIVLDRNGCQTLANAGGGVFRVFNLERYEDANGNPVDPSHPDARLVTYPGTVTVDTIPATGGSDCQAAPNGRKVIDAKTSTGSLIMAEGDIFAYGMLHQDPTNTYTFPINAAPPLGTNLQPAPKAGPIITRSLVDYQFNCLTGGYPGSSVPWSPSVKDQPIDPCPVTVDGAGNDITPPPYLKNLDDVISAIDYSDLSTGVPGWAIFPDDAAGVAACDGAVGTVAPDLTAPAEGRRWIINCPSTGPGSDPFKPSNLTFSGVDHIIFPHGLKPSTGDNLKIHGTDTLGTIVSMPQGGLQRGGGHLEMRNVFVYIRSTGSGADFVLTGSAGRFALQAPLDDSGCASYGGGLPPASCFAPLALWSNYTATGGGPTPPNEVRGNASGGIIGTFFAPNAQFRFRGSGDDTGGFCGSADWDTVLLTSSTLQLEGAQFFAESIDIAADAKMGMCPSPETTLGVPIRGSGLIR